MGLKENGHDVMLLRIISWRPLIPTPLETEKEYELLDLAVPPIYNIAYTELNFVIVYARAVQKDSSTHTHTHTHNQRERAVVKYAHGASVELGGFSHRWEAD